MKFGQFFKTTPLYKEYIILTLVAKDSHVTQRDLAIYAGVSSAAINTYIDEFEEKGLLKRNYLSIKNVEYMIMPKGEMRRKYLNMDYLESALEVFNEAKDGCKVFLNKLVSKGFKNVIFYGAGEVCEILLSILNVDQSIKLNVPVLIDDDVNKQGNTLVNKNIVSLQELENYTYDAILVSTYANSKVVKEKLLDQGIKEELIIEFFEEE